MNIKEYLEVFIVLLDSINHGFIDLSIEGNFPMRMSIQKCYTERDRGDFIVKCDGFNIDHHDMFPRYYFFRRSLINEIDEFFNRRKINHKISIKLMEFDAKTREYSCVIDKIMEL